MIGLFYGDDRFRQVGSLKIVHGRAVLTLKTGTKHRC